MANEMMVYETSLGTVNLSAEQVVNHLVRGNGNITEGEVMMFMAMCKAQKLNPFVNGEVYLIKFGSEPAQMVIGYDTYKRRADDNPSFLYKESGIVVQRGNEIVKKEGACLYPTETLIGGWCRVHKIRNEKEVVTYKEVSFSEYNKEKSLWKTLPCTMIEKVAVSQALREAFPTDYEGLYTSAEISGFEPMPEPERGDEPVSVDVPISQKERKELFKVAQELYGQEEGNKKVKQLLDDEGLESTTGMRYSVWERIMNKLTDKEVVNEEDVENKS